MIDTNHANHDIPKCNILFGLQAALAILTAIALASPPVRNLTIRPFIFSNFLLKNTPSQFNVDILPFLILLITALSTC